MDRGKRKKSIVLVVVFVLVLVAVGIVIGNLSSLVTDNTNTVETADSSTFTGMETVYIDGEGYLRKNDIKTYLLIGLDKDGALDYSEDSYNQGNQADFILLFVLNENDGSYDLIHINRDTMADVKKLGMFGDVTGTRNMQICLAHAYGDGRQTSCLNTVDAVSNFMYGITVDRYISTSMSAVQQINDFVGGVPIVIQEDLTSIDPSMTVGANVTLLGENALAFVRGRKGVGDQTNIGRMDRQQQYMTALVNQIKVCGKAEDDFISLYNEMEDYIVSDCGINDLRSIYKSVKESDMKAIISPTGESIVNEGYMEFHADENSVKDIVKTIFFEKIEK